MPDAGTIGPLLGLSIAFLDDFDGDIYRTVYTLTLPDADCVLHAFQKKAKKGIATSRRDMELIKQRLKWAGEMHAERTQALERNKR